MEELHDRGPIEPRSRRDRAAIVAPSVWNHFHSIGRRAMLDQDHNHGPIAARSWPDRGMIVVNFEAKIETILPQIRELRRRTRESFPRRRNRRSRPAPSSTISSPISSLKSHVLLLCSLTFDRFVKELSKFRGRSLVHRDPPTFRLNSEGIGSGLITNSSLISLNFPLEFRKSVRKDPSKFTPIHANWSLILVAIGLVVRFDRLSGGNLNFY